MTALADGEVLGAASPPLDIAWVRSIAARHYGRVGEILPLSGERDRNYRISLPGGRFMLKVSHPAEPSDVADFQTRALLHLAARDPGLPVQRIVPALDGEPACRAVAADGLPRVVRLFGWLDGLPLPEAPRSAVQRLNVARMLARVDAALADFRHPAGALDLPWDIQRAESVRGLLAEVPDPQRRRLAENALDRFERLAKPVLATLPRQPIHNDFNIHNLLVDPAGPDRIVGVLDFGDMVEAPRIDDLAVAAAYQLGTDGAALDELAAFVAAYHRTLPLRPDELALLFTLIEARLVMVVAISGWRAARHPGNAAYLLRNNAVSWARLAACDRIGADAAADAFRRACAAGPA